MGQLVSGWKRRDKAGRHATLRRGFQGSEADVASDDGTRITLPEPRKDRSFSASQPLVTRYEEQTQKRILTTGCSFCRAPDYGSYIAR